jgi:hypothetical protein
MNIRARLSRLERQRQIAVAGLMSDEERRARLAALVARAERGDLDARERLEKVREIFQRVRERLAREGRKP